MSTLSRRLPTSNEGRQIALDAAKEKNDSLPPATAILTAATKTRLNTIQPVYSGLIVDLGTAAAASTNSTALKDKAQATARLWISHYYQALNNAIEREVYPAAVRAFFNIDVNQKAVPEMVSEETVKLWGERVTTGETAMVAAGYAAVPFPTASDVKTKVDDYKTKLVTQSTLMDATDTAQEKIDLQNDEADKVIKKVWDEVETYYNEETEESKRANARQWGVKYVHIGDPTTLTLVAVDEDGHPVVNVDFRVVSTGHHHDSGATNKVEIVTRILGEETITASHVAYLPASKNITIAEGVAQTVTIVMHPLPVAMP